VEAAHVSIDRGMDKHNVVHTYIGLVFSHKRERNSDISYNMGKPWEHYAK
jgi:hypothetical protein